MKPLASGRPRHTRRALTLADLDAVMSIEVSVYPHPWSRGNFIDSIAAAYLAEVLHDEAGRIIGYFIAMTGVDELHLLNITVAASHQGQGCGRGLLDAVQAHGERLRMAQMWLEVRASNLRARALYRARGFAEVGLRRAYYPGPDTREDAVVMRLALGEARDVD